MSSFNVNGLNGAAQQQKFHEPKSSKITIKVEKEISIKLI